MENQQDERNRETEGTEMMKRILAVFAAMMVLFSAAALAEDLSSLTDRELMKLYLDVMDEMRNRTDAEEFHEVGAPVDAEFEADTAVLERVVNFFDAWKDNNYNDMIELCASEWKAKENENPKIALFSILQNRTPESVQLETISGSSADSSRQLNILVLMNYNNQKGPVLLRMTAIMVREEDGLWYINPESLLSFKLVNDN